MTVNMTDVAARKILDTGYDDIYDNGFLQYRSGAAAGSGQPAGGTLLASLPTGAAFLAPSAGRSKSQTAEISGPAALTGVATHYRLVANGDTDAATQNEAREEGSIAQNIVIVDGAQNGGNYEINTASPHGLTTGQTVTIAGHSRPGANGRWICTVIDADTFSIATNPAGAGVGGTVHNGDMGIENVNIAQGQTVSMKTFKKSI